MVHSGMMLVRSLSGQHGKLGFLERVGCSDVVNGSVLLEMNRRAKHLISLGYFAVEEKEAFMIVL